MKRVSKPVVKDHQLIPRVAKPVAEDTLPPLRLTATEIAHMLVAITDYDCDAHEEYHPMIAKLSYHLAMAHLYR
jgi:hypothetical protein